MHTLGLLLTFALWGCSVKPGALAEIDKLGGKVTIDKKSPDKAVISVDLKLSDVTDTGLENLKEFTKLQSLNLTGTKVSDAGLEHLKGLTQLQSLYLRETKVTDVERLKGLSQLQELNLWGTQVNDARLESWKA